MDSDNKLTFEEIEIHSQERKQLLRLSPPYWEDIITDSDQPPRIESPFGEFVWHWDEYAQASVPQNDDTESVKIARTDLADPLELIKNSAKLKTYFRSRELLRTSKKIRFEYLWTLFGPGTQACAHSYVNELQLFEVTRCPDPGYEKDFWIECSAFDWEGSRFSIFSYDFWIKQFPGEKPINSLVIYPLKEYRNFDGSNGLEQLKEKLTKRARSYVAMCTQQPGIVQCDYQGTALVTPTALHSLTSKGLGQVYGLQSSDDNDEIEAASIEMTGKKSRVIIDNLSFVKSGRNIMKLGDTPPLGKRIASFSIECVCSVCKTSVVQRWRPTSTFDEPLDALGKAFMEDEDRLLLLREREQENHDVD
jgi:hypothetical protein